MFTSTASQSCPALCIVAISTKNTHFGDTLLYIWCDVDWNCFHLNFSVIDSRIAVTKVFQIKHQTIFHSVIPWNCFKNVRKQRKQDEQCRWPENKCKLQQSPNDPGHPGLVRAGLWLAGWGGQLAASPPIGGGLPPGPRLAGGRRRPRMVAEVTEADAGTRASIWHSGQSCGRGNISCNIGNISLVVVIILAVATIII